MTARPADPSAAQPFMDRVMQPDPSTLPRDPIVPEDFDSEGRFLYPGDVEDGVPEAHLSWWLGCYLVQTIFRLVADPATASVHADMPIYYQQFEPQRHVSPDAFYLPGVPMDRLRRSYCLWKTGVAPAIVFEVVSRGYFRKDVVVNRRRYESLGIPEYYWFDHERGLLTALQLNPETRRYRTRSPKAEGRYLSPALGLEVGLDDQGVLCLYQDGAPIPPTEDLNAELEARLAELDARLEEQDARLAEQDARLAQLQAELRRLREGEEPPPSG